MLPKRNPLFAYGSGKASVHVARMRMGLCPLNQYRFNYNYIQDASCPACGFRREDLSHYFLDCPAYQAARVTLFQSVGVIVSDIFPDIHHVHTKRMKDSLVKIMINGDSRLDMEINHIVFDSVYDYVVLTRRMDV